MSGIQFFADRYTQLGWKFRNVQAKQAIRLNHTRVKGKNLPERLRSAGLQLEKVPFLQSGYWVIKSKVSAGATAEYLLGYYSMQETAAQIPVSLFTNLKAKSVLDACAAPGGKTVHLADVMANTGTIVALDVDVRRLVALGNHLERCHVSNSVVYNMDARAASQLGLKFDRVLLDVPCSGNFAGDPAWFSNRTLEDVERNAVVQREILTEAVKCLADNGEIVYSTCSLEPEEDEVNIDWAIKNLGLRTEEITAQGLPGLTEVFGQKLDPQLARCRRLWPGDTQGFFAAKLKRSQTA
jgi:tRNA (cytosine40_48-C5)-methyltransferase